MGHACVQAYLDPKANPEYSTWLRALRQLTSQNGAGALLSGLAPRAFRICGATLILGTIRTQLVGLVERSRTGAQPGDQPQAPG